MHILVVKKKPFFVSTDIFVVKYTGRGLVVKRPGVLSKVQMLTLVLGVGVFSWEVLNGVGVDGVGEIFPFFYAFFPFFYAFFPFFFAFLCFSKRTRANNSNLLQKWGISLRPRLHRPRAKLPDFPFFFQNVASSVRLVSPEATLLGKQAFSCLAAAVCIGCMTVAGCCCGKGIWSAAFTPAQSC